MKVPILKGCYFLCNAGGYTPHVLSTPGSPHNYESCSPPRPNLHHTFNGHFALIHNWILLCQTRANQVHRGR